jgi:hypothetical protein
VLSARQTRRYLGLLGAKWRCTVGTLAQKQDADRVKTAKKTLTARKRGPAATDSRWTSSTSAASTLVSQRALAGPSRTSGGPRTRTHSAGR